MQKKYRECLELNDLLKTKENQIEMKRISIYSFDKSSSTINATSVSMRIKQMKQERKDKKKDKIDKIDKYLSVFRKQESKPYETGLTMEIIKDKDKFTVNYPIGIKDKILISLCSSETLKQLVGKMESGKFIRHYQWDMKMKTKEPLQLQQEHFSFEKIMILIETKEGNIFGFIQIIDTESEKKQNKKCYFISVVNPQIKEFMICKKKNPLEFISFPDQKSNGEIIFDHSITLFSSKMKRSYDFKRFYKSQFDLDFYCEFNKSQMIDWKGIQIFQWI